jgi:acetyl-CoA carboxylase biotin carboxyl carrier protein
MADQPAGASEMFDIRLVRRLVKLMDENELSELELRDGAKRIRLRKRGSEAVPVVAGFAPAGAGAAAAAAPPVEPRAAAPVPAEPAAAHFSEIKSPMVGTFYSASAPDSPPYVTPGSHVEPDTVVCIIEAMKVFNEIQAELRGKIVAVLVDNGQPVEFGQPLFRVDPTA